MASKLSETPATVMSDSTERPLVALGYRSKPSLPCIPAIRSPGFNLVDLPPRPKEAPCIVRSDLFRSLPITTTTTSAPNPPRRPEGAPCIVRSDLFTSRPSTNPFRPAHPHKDVLGTVRVNITKPVTNPFTLPPLLKEASASRILRFIMNPHPTDPFAPPPHPKEVQTVVRSTTPKPSANPFISSSHLTPAPGNAGMTGANPDALPRTGAQKSVRPDLPSFYPAQQLTLLGPAPKNRSSINKKPHATFSTQSSEDFYDYQDKKAMMPFLPQVGGKPAPFEYSSVAANNKIGGGYPGMMSPLAQVGSRPAPLTSHSIAANHKAGGGYSGFIDNGNGGMMSPWPQVGGKTAPLISSSIDAHQKVAGGYPDMIEAKDFQSWLHEKEKKRILTNDRSNFKAGPRVISAVDRQEFFWTHVTVILCRCTFRSPVFAAGLTSYCTSLSTAKYPDAINILCAEDSITDLAVMFVEAGRWYPCPTEDSSKMEDDIKKYGIYRGPHIIIEQIKPQVFSYNHIFFHPIETFEKKMMIDLGKGKYDV